MLNKSSLAVLVKYGVLLLLVIVLSISFGLSHAWTSLCYGLALFLFGMQCIEEGLNNAAGTTLEHLMSKSTATPARGMLFGMVAAFILQSTTLVSLLTIAFLGTGLITLAGGIAILLGTNLGATSGIWLLALLGKSISLSPISVPLFIFGIIASFFKGRVKSIGRVFIGISLIFLGVDTLKAGFDALGNQVDFTHYQLDGMMNITVFTGIGLFITIILQSTHATLILTLAALAGGQISIEQAFAIAIGSNVGSSLSTALVGMLGSARSGQRLALAHLIFNVVTAVLSLILWVPLATFTQWIGREIGLNALLQLALFHTLFNLLGVAVFWRLQERLALLLSKWLPSVSQKEMFSSSSEQEDSVIQTRYLNNTMLRSGDTAVRAIFFETRHLMILCLEVLCHAAYIPLESLYIKEDKKLDLPKAPLKLNAKSLYEEQIKRLFGEILSFNGRMNVSSEKINHHLFQLYLMGSYLLEMVKEGKGMQKAMYHSFSTQNALLPLLLDIREHLWISLRYFVSIALLPVDSPEWNAVFNRFQ